MLSCTRSDSAHLIRSSRASFTAQPILLQRLIRPALRGQLAPAPARAHSHDRTRGLQTSSSMSTKYSAKVVDRLNLEDRDAKWVGLKAIKWVDPSGKERTWEAADRKTRKGEVDGEPYMPRN